MFNKIVYLLFSLFLVLSVATLEILTQGIDVKGQSFLSSLALFNIVLMYLLPIFIYIVYLFLEKNISMFFIPITTNFACLISQYFTYYILTGFKDWSFKNFLSGPLWKYNGILALVFSIIYFVIYLKQRK